MIFVVPFLFGLHMENFFWAMQLAQMQASMMQALVQPQWPQAYDGSRCYSHWANMPHHLPRLRCQLSLPKLLKGVNLLPMVLVTSRSNAQEDFVLQSIVAVAGHLPRKWHPLHLRCPPLRPWLWILLRCLINHWNPLHLRYSEGC